MKRRQAVSTIMGKEICIDVETCRRRVHIHHLLKGVGSSPELWPCAICFMGWYQTLVCDNLCLHSQMVVYRLL